MRWLAMLTVPACPVVHALPGHLQRARHFYYTFAPCTLQHGKGTLENAHVMCVMQCSR
jgi:hypothetical protein